MFQSRRQATLANINLGSLSAPPSFEDMHFLLEQATRYRGRFVEVSWSMGRTDTRFQLTTKVQNNQPLPVWMLYKIAGGSSNLVWGHNSNDLTLMHNLVMLECERVANHGDEHQISSGAMESIMDNNASSGSMIRPEVAASADLQSQAQQNAVTAGAQNFGGADPASTWLRNLASQAPDPAEHVQTAERMESALAATAVVPQAPAAAPPEVEKTSARSPNESQLDGSLTNITVPNLLRYCNENRLSGRISFQSSQGVGEVFLRSGDLKHVATLESKGENALYDIATWFDGDFTFLPDEQTTQQTLAYETTVLIANCQRMYEFFSFLKQAGLRSNSFLHHTENDMQKARFEQTLQKNGVPLDIAQQWRLYQSISGNGTLFDLLRTCPMTRSEWIPILYNLIRARFVQIADKPLIYQPGMFLEPVALDTSALDKFLLTATNPSDGLLTRGCFLWLLQQEFNRFERTGSRFALVIFSLASTSLLDGNVVPLPQHVFVEACRRVLAVKRRLDLIGHFDGEYAMLLPETDGAGAAVFANRVCQLLKKPALSPELQDADRMLVASFGIAAIPDDVRDLGALIAAARAAKDKSKMMGAPVVLYGQ